MTAFISYRRDDSADVTGRIYDRLAAHFGREAIFKDVDNIPLGVNFRDYMTDLMVDVSVVLVVIGRNWVTITDKHGNRRLEDANDFVRMEIEMALANRLPIVPLLVGGGNMPKGYELPNSIRNLVLYNGVPIRPDPDFHSDMDRLITSLESYIVVPSMQTRPSQKTSPLAPNSRKAKTRIATPRPDSPAIKEWADISAPRTKKPSGAHKAVTVQVTPNTKPSGQQAPTRWPFWRLALLTGAFGWPLIVWVLTEFYFFVTTVVAASLISGGVMLAATAPLVWIRRKRYKRKQP